MTGLPATKFCAIEVPRLAEEALWQELELTPKPGLVDRLNNGAHHDMDHALFVRSITAITLWLSRFTELGVTTQTNRQASSCVCYARWALPASRQCMPQPAA